MSDEFRRALDDHKRDTDMRFNAHDRRLRVLEAEPLRIIDEVKHAVDGMLIGARAHIEKSVKDALAPVRPQLEDLFKLNEEQMTLLRDSARERERRRLREEDDQKKRDEEARLAKARLDELHEKQLAADLTAKRWTVPLALIGFVVAIVSALIGAAVMSHQGPQYNPPPSQSAPAAPHH